MVPYDEMKFLIYITEALFLKALGNDMGSATLPSVKRILLCKVV